MTVKAEYKVNDFLILKLETDQERDRTIIYVNGKEFMQCHFLLLQIPKERIHTTHEINSVDEAEKKLNNKHERNPNIITPEEEFVAHCSNLQA